MVFGISFRPGCLAIVLYVLSVCVDAAAARPVQTDAGEAARQAGLEYLRNGQFHSAVEAYRNGLLADPAREQLYLELTDILIAAGLAGEAGEVLREAAVRFPESISPNYNLLYHDLSELWVRTGRLSSARDAMVEASRFEGPISGLVIYRRIGDFSADLLRFEEALEAYHNALRVDPEDAVTRLALGRLHLKRNDPDAALAEFNSLVASGWDGADIRHGIAEVHWRRGDLREAVLAADRVLLTAPEHAGALYIRGSALIRLGSRDTGQSALAEYRRLQAMAEDDEHRRRDIQTFRSGAMARVMRGEYAEAIELFERGVEAYPYAEELYLGLGQAQSEAGRHEDAIATFTTWLERGLDGTNVAYENLMREYRLVDDDQTVPDPD